jgi:short-subunit dehydrogenase
MNFTDQKALVTGANKGIGRAIALALAGAGVEVLGTSRNPGATDWPDGVTPVTFDTSSPESVQHSWESAGLSNAGITLLVNNAGTGTLGEFQTSLFADWEAQINLLLMAPMKLCHLAMEQWGQTRPGIIVNVTSMVVEYPIPCMSGYNAAKTGLAAFSESLMIEGMNDWLTVIELRPGDLHTNFNNSIKRTSDTPRVERIWRAMVKHIEAAPSPEVAAQKLITTLRNEAGGVVRAGSLFQIVMASIFGKIVSSKVKRAANLSYYNLR